MPKKTSSSPKSPNKKKLFKQNSEDLDDIFDKDISDTGNNNNHDGTDEEMLESTPQKSHKRKSDSSPSPSSKKNKQQSPATKKSKESPSSKKKRMSSDLTDDTDTKKSPSVKKESSPKQSKTPKKSPQKTPQKSPKLKITVKEESEEEMEPKQGKGTWGSLFGQSSLLSSDDIELLSPLKTPRAKGGKVEKKAEKKFNKVWNEEQAKKHEHSEAIQLSAGKLKIGYHPKKSKTEPKILTVQTERPLDKDNKISYFEITIDEFSAKENEDGTIPATVFVGLTPAGYANDIPIGWETDSCGYSNNALKWTGNGRFGTSKAYGESFEKGDIIGCGLLHNSGEIFFTKNGMFQGIAAYIRPGTPYALFPSVSLHAGNAVTLNYGQKSFSFDIKSTHYKQPSPTSSKTSPVKSASPYKSPKPSTPVRAVPQDILCGLFLGKIPAPLMAASVRGTIVDSVGRVDVLHEYNNPLPDAVDAIFVFPIDDTTKVFSFRVEIEGHVVLSHVTKPEGKQYGIYVHSLLVRSSQDFLSDLPAHCIRAHSFQCHINQVPAGKNIHIAISYLAQMDVVARTPLRTRAPLLVQSSSPTMNVDISNSLNVEGEDINYLDFRENINMNVPVEQSNLVNPRTDITQYSFKFLLPATVYPHYCANWQDEVFFPEVRKPDFIPSKLNADIRITHMEAVISDVQSDKVQLDLQKISRHEVRVKFSTRMSIDIDFVVNVLDSHAPQVFVEREAASNSAAALISWVPIYAQQTEGCEVNIVVDWSAKETFVLEDLARVTDLCLRCIFFGKIQVFFMTGGNSFVKVFDQPERFNNESLNRVAHALLRQTEKKNQKAKSIDIEKVLKEILEEPANIVPHGSYQDIIFIKHAATQLDNQDHTRTYANKKCNVPESNIRVFGLVVDPKYGSGEDTPDTEFLDSLCRLANGTLFKLPSAKNGLAVINEVVKHAMTSSVSKINVNCHTTKPFIQVPTELPTLFFGDRLVTYMLFKTSDIALKSVTIKCDSIFHAETLTTDNIKEFRHTSIIKHAAKWRIDELRAQLLRGSGNKAQITKEIEELSLHHQLVSDVTIITMQDQPTAVPVPPPEGQQPAEEGEAPTKKKQKKTANALAEVHIDKLSVKEVLNLTHDIRRKRINEMVRTEHDEKDEILEQLILLQTAEGYWNLDKSLAELLLVPWETCNEQSFLKSTPRKVRFEDRLNEADENAETPEETAERFKTIFATSLALCYMDFYVPRRHLEYEMIRAKARRWLRRQSLKDEPTWPEWLETGKEFLIETSKWSVANV